jgi:type II secretory pathway component GspD/PulD (secretin)
MVVLRRRWRFVLLAAALLGAGVFGVAPRAGADEPRGSDVAEIVIQDGTSIEDFLRAVGPRLGTHIGWDPGSKIVKDKRLVGGVHRAESNRLLTLVRNLLVPYDLALVPMGAGSERWYFAFDAKQQGAMLKMKPEVIDLTDANADRYLGEDGLFVTATIRVQAMRSLRDARQALTKVTTQNLGSVTEVPDANAFVVTDFAPNVVAIYRLIRQMDVAPSDAGNPGAGKLVSLKHARAEDLARILSVHFAAPVAPPATQVPGMVAPIAIPPGPRVTPDSRTNQLLVAGTAAEIRDALEVIKGLDVEVQRTAPAPAMPIAAQVIPLRSARAQELANVLQNVVNSSHLWRAPDGSRPSFTADGRTNALVVTGSESALAAVRELVRSLDPEVPAASPVVAPGSK